MPSALKLRMTRTPRTSCHRLGLPMLSIKHCAYQLGAGLTTHRFAAVGCGCVLGSSLERFINLAPLKYPGPTVKLFFDSLDIQV